MEQIKKNFGFGCMRLPMNGENIDMAETCRMVDAFLDAGFNYFDTARGYLQGKSELALRECLTSRYPRKRYILTDYPQIKVVQIQFNYPDYDDPAVQSRRCYEVCRKFGKPVIVMEPVKGGNLVNLPDDARRARRAPRRQPRELCHPLRRGLSRDADGALRHEQPFADGGQHRLLARLPAAG